MMDSSLYKSIILNWIQRASNNVTLSNVRESIFDVTYYNKKVAFGWHKFLKHVFYYPVIGV